MSVELLNTSAPRGLRPGSTGFCTVGMTAGISSALEERLTLLSGYRWLVPPGESGAGNNPVAYSHWRLMSGGRTQSILSRVCDAGFDYSRRSNRFAHHIVIESDEQAEPGPAWVMLQPGVMRTGWASEPMVFPEGPDIPRGIALPRVCSAWKTATGDAGWAGVLAESFTRDPSRVAWIIYPPGLEMLPLVDEAIALLRPALRWQVTFCTYFSDLPAGLDCAWRFCPAGSRAAIDAARQPGGGLLIDLTQSLPPASDNVYVAAARNGSTVARQAESPRLLQQIADSPKSGLITPTPTVSDSVGSTLRTIDSQSRESVGHADPLQNKHVSSTARTNGGADGLPISLPNKDTGGPPVPRNLFRLFAIVWPVVVAIGVVAYIRHTRASKAVPFSPAMTSPAAPLAPPTQPTSQPADETKSVSLIENPATTQAVPTTQTPIDDRDRTIAQLRDAIAQMKDDLASARLGAQGGAAAQTELDALKLQYAALQKKLAAASTTQPTAMPVDHTVELFRDEVELWPGDGNGPPDSLQLDSYKPPEILLVERSSNQIALKSVTSATAGAPPLPTELAVITIDGQRVVLKWVTANRALIAAPIRAWLQLARLTVSRQGHVIGTARFVPLRSTEINVDHEALASLLPDVKSKEALSHIGLAAPATTPAGWAARQADGQTVTFASTTVSGATFDVKVSITSAGEVVTQTTYAIALYKQFQASLDPNATPAAKKSAEDAAAALRGLPPLWVFVVNRDNGLVLMNVKIKGGE